MKLSTYHRMPAAEKAELAADRAREQGVRCPLCETETTPPDLLAHIAARCTGPREPHRGARWVGSREAVALGTSHGTLSRWALSGVVRTKGTKHRRLYLLRDLVRALAWKKRLSRAGEKPSPPDDADRSHKAKGGGSGIGSSRPPPHAGEELRGISLADESDGMSSHPSPEVEK